MNPLYFLYLFLAVGLLFALGVYADVRAARSERRGKRKFDPWE